jgi:hypothetical protein
MKLTPSYTFTIKKAGAKMGISKKQFTLAAKAGLTREQASRFIGTAGQEPSPTEAYDKVGQLLKGRTPGQAMKQVQPELKKPEPKPSALAGIKPIEPKVSQAQPLAQPKTEATNATEMIKPVEQPKKFEKRKLTKWIDEKLREEDNWKEYESIDLGQQDPRNNTVFSLFEKGDNPFNKLGASFNHFTDNNYIRNMGSEVELGIRKNASVRVIIHEMGHLIDAYCGRTIKNTPRNFLSNDENFTKVVDMQVQLFKSKDKNFEKNLIGFKKENDAFYKEASQTDLSKFYPDYKKLKDEMKFYDEKSREIYLKTIKEEATFEERQLWRQYTNKLPSIINKLDEIETKYGFASGKQVASSMDDIISALTEGYANRDKNRYGFTIRGQHKPSYWKDITTKSKNHEIFTHYLTMKSHPDKKFLNNFKKHFPEMNNELERLYDQAYQIMGGK